MTKFTLNKKSLLSLLSALLAITFYLLTEQSGLQTNPVITDPNYIDHIASSSSDQIPIDQAESSSTISTSTHSNDSLLYTVTKVIDGDTFEVKLADKLEKVRLIGINTPETVNPRKKVECFGHEASDHAKQLLTSQKVRLETDASQDERDKYGRLLVYAYLPDGTFFNLAMIKDGYAYEYTYKTPYVHQTEFKAAQSQAKEQQLGLWSAKTCAGKK